MLTEVVGAGCVAYILRWIYKAGQAVNDGLADAEEIKTKQEQDAEAVKYADLSREDWESLGLSEDWLRAHVGEANYRSLMARWYPPPVTHTAMDRALARIARRRHGVE